MHFSIQFNSFQTDKPASYIKTDKIQNERFSQKKRDFILEPKTSNDYHAKFVSYLRFCGIFVRDE